MALLTPIWRVLVLALALSVPLIAAEKPTASELQSFTALRNEVTKNIHLELEAMARISGAADSDADFATVRTALKNNLDSLELLFQEGKINPFFGHLVSEGPARFVKEGSTEHQRPLRIGYFPVAADPFHWAHLLTALEAMVQLQLDKVVFIVAGRDDRKPELSTAELRHPMAKQTLAHFGELFVYSDITLQEGSNSAEEPSKLTSNGTNDGETNIFHDLARNRHLPILAFYIVGSDHFNWTVTKNGKIQDDTVKKIEDNMKKAHLGFAASQGKHHLVAAFIARNAGEICEAKIAEMKAKITYDLKMVVPSLSYSSTQIRTYFLGKTPEDKRALHFVPACTYQFIVDHGLYKK